MSEIREDLKAYLDGELPDARAAEVSAALDADPTLQEEAQFMKRLSDSFRNLTRGPEPVGGEAALPHPRPSLMRWLMPVTAAAASILVVAMVASTLTSRKESARRLRPSFEAPAPASADMAPSSGMLMAKPEEKSAGNAFAGEESPRTPSASGADTSWMPRSVVRTANLAVKVDSAAQAEGRAAALVKGWGGFVESSDSTSVEAVRPVVTMTVRVPEKRFDDALKEFEALGTRISKSVTGQDVTAQLVDIGARIKNLKAQEETYRAILRQAKRVGEVIEVQQQLTQIRGEIESMEAQMKSLKGLAALSTITLTLQQRPAGDPEQKDKGWATDAWAGATEALTSACQEIAKAVIWVFVYAPIWLPIAFVIWLAARRALRK